jgi:hypothetical protein
MNKKKGRGRPELDEAIAKNKTLPVRFTSSDLESIKVKAKLAGQTLTEFVRKQLLGD